MHLNLLLNIIPISARKIEMTKKYQNAKDQELKKSS